MTITEREAEDMLRKGLSRYADGIWPAFKRQPTENQFGAFVSLAWNVGIEGVKSSTALRRFNKGKDEKAAEAMTWWNKAGGKVMRGLVRRREAEVDLFMEEVPGEQSYRVKPDGDTLWQAIAKLISRIFGGDL